MRSEQKLVEGRLKSDIFEQREERKTWTGRKPDYLAAVRIEWPLSDGASPTRVAHGEIRYWEEWASISPPVAVHQLSGSSPGIGSHHTHGLAGGGHQLIVFLSVTSPEVRPKWDTSMSTTIRPSIPHAHFGSSLKMISILTFFSSNYHLLLGHTAISV